METSLALSPLPLECLQMIIRQITASHDGVLTLAALLRTNKYICSATLPIMYENPLLFRRFVIERPPSDEVLANLLRLIRVLLCSVPKDRITPLLKAAYLDNDAQATVESKSEEPLTVAAVVSNNSSSLTQIPYHSFITAIDFQPVFHPNKNIFYNRTLCHNTLLHRELDSGGYRRRYQAEGVNDDLVYHDPDKVLDFGIARDLRRDLTWALSVNAENIRTLVISIADVTRYLEQVHRFKALTDVTFLIDRDLNNYQPPGRELSIEQQEMLRLQRTERTRHYEEMLSFVQKHRRIHVGVLRTGRCIPDDIANTKEYCPMEYHSRFWQSLPQLVRPHLIDSRNWIHFVEKVQETDLSFVESLRQGTSSKHMSWNRLSTQLPFLHRCRALKEINLASLGDDTFQWAVDERKQYLANIAAGRPCERPLVSLRRFRVTYRHLSAGRHLNDVLYAFSDTLAFVTAFGIWNSSQADFHGLPAFSIGSDYNSNNSSWSLPRLEELTINSNDINLRIHSDFLGRCPRLKNINLRDSRRNYSLEEVVYWKPVALPELNHLTLFGTSALSFHPDTLWATPELMRLHLGLLTFHEEATFIPPVEQLDAFWGQQQQQVQENHGNEEEADTVDNMLANYNNINNINNNNNNSSSSSSSSNSDNISLMPPLPRRPVWTWDWHLPKLTRLHLTSEFAYRFQFKMLSGTPGLRTFYLNIRTISMEHKRTVSLEDLLSPNFKLEGLGEFFEQDKVKRHRRQMKEQRLSDLENTRSGGELEHEMAVNKGGQDEGEVEEEASKIWRDFEYVEASALTSFTMLGPWTLEGRRVLEVLFNKVAPNIMWLVMKDCNGYNLLDVVETTSKYLHTVQGVNVSVPFAPMDEVVEAGLEYVPGYENLDQESTFFRLVKVPDERTSDG
ncbi:hypothetical protein BGZ95_004022, partial [Linnemannia exigua]